MKTIKFLLLLSVSSLLAMCAHRAVQDKILNLEQVTLDFDVADFYAEKIANTESTLSKDPKKLEKKEVRELLQQTLFGKDTLNFYHNGNDTIIDKKAYKDTRENQGIFGYDYSTIAYQKGDSLAVLNGVYFEQIDMLESKKGEFLALYATNETDNPKNHLNLTSYLTKKYGKPKHTFEENRKNQETLDWENDKELIILETKVDTIENVLSMSADGKKEIERIPNHSITYFKFNKAKLNIIKKIRIGEWIICSRADF